MISFSVEVEKHRENETKNGAHARFEPGTSKSLQKLSFLSPARLISHFGCDENGKKKVSSKEVHKPRYSPYFCENFVAGL